MKLGAAFQGLPFVLLLAACSSKEEIRPVTHNFSNSLRQEGPQSSFGEFNNTKEITVLTAIDKSADKDKARSHKARVKANQKRHDVDGDHWGKGREIGIPKHPDVPGFKKKGIPIINWSYELDK